MSKPTGYAWQKYLLIIFSAVMIVIIVAAGITLITPQPTTLIVYKKAPSFTLTDENNNNVTLNTFLGKTLIMDFIYTHCPNPNGTLGECSTETVKMGTLLSDLMNMGYTGNDFHLISISIDWKFDNVSTMKAYGQDRGEGQFQYWSFLSGTKSQIENISKGYYIEADYINTTNTFNQTVPVVTQPIVNNTVEYMSHSLMVYLIDKHGYIRIPKDKQGTLLPITGTDWLAKNVAKYVSQLIKE